MRYRVSLVNAARSAVVGFAASRQNSLAENPGPRRSRLRSLARAANARKLRPAAPSRGSAASSASASGR
eukprot:9910453-Alexandrium_andersonii.AAC.1